MQLHERTLVVANARHELTLFLLELEKKHSLSYGETFSLLGKRNREPCEVSDSL